MLDAGTTAEEPRYVDGALDEFRIYERVLSAGEIAYLAGHRQEVTATEKP